VIFPAGRLLVAESLPADNKQKSVLVKYKKDYETRTHEDASTLAATPTTRSRSWSKPSRRQARQEKVRTAIENTHGLVGTAVSSISQSRTTTGWRSTPSRC